MANLHEEVTRLSSDLKKMSDKVSVLEKKLSQTQGVPIVQGFSGNKFTLNAPLNVIELNKRIQAITDLLDTIQESLLIGPSGEWINIKQGWKLVFTERTMTWMKWFIPKKKWIDITNKFEWDGTE